MKRSATVLVCMLSATACFAVCRTTPPVPDEMSLSNAVIIGTVTESRLVPQAWDSLDGTEYTVHIDKKVKGKPSGEITIFSEHSDNSLKMQSGRQYLLFLTNENTRWSVNKCGNSGAMDDESAVLKQLGHSANLN